ncbi:MAG: sensor histidine kinase [Bacteroidia bacterium]
MKKFHNKKLFFLILILSHVFSNAQNIENIKNNTHSKIDTIRFAAYSDLVWELKDLNKTEARNYATKLISEAKKKGNKKWIAQGYNDIGIVNLRNGNIDTALISFQKSLKLRKELNSPKDIVSSLAKIGNIYVEQLKYSDAINLFIEASKISEKHGLQANLGLLYGNIATVYNTLNQYKLAITYARKSLEIHQAMQNKAGYGVCYSTIGSCMADIGLYDSSLYYLEQAKVFLYEEGLYNEYCTAVNNLGQIHRKFNHSEKGIPYYIEAIKISKEIGDTLGFIIYETNLAVTLMENGKLEEAEKIYKEAIDISIEKKLTENLFKIYRGAVSLYIYKKDLKEANRYFDLYNNLKDSTFSKDFSKQLSEMQTKYEVEKKDATILKNELEIERQKKQGAIKNIIIIISIIILLLLFIAYFITKKYNRIKQQISQQQLINKISFETEQKERERIARDLHDSVGQKLSVVKMQLSIKNSDKQTACVLLDEAIQDVRVVSHNLMPTDLSRGLINAIENLCEQINDTSFVLKVHFNKTLEVTNLEIDNQRALLIYRIVQELLNNSVKYAEAKNIHINMDCNKKMLQLYLSDDGKGFDITSLEQKDGIGIKGIKDRVKKLSGNINLLSELGKGTKYEISIPL